MLMSLKSLCFCPRCSAASVPCGVQRSSQHWYLTAGVAPWAMGRGAMGRLGEGRAMGRGEGGRWPAGPWFGGGIAGGEGGGWPWGERGGGWAVGGGGGDDPLGRGGGGDWLGEGGGGAAAGDGPRGGRGVARYAVGEAGAERDLPAAPQRCLPLPPDGAQASGA